MPRSMTPARRRLVLAAALAAAAAGAAAFFFLRESASGPASITDETQRMTRRLAALHREQQRDAATIPADSEPDPWSANKPESIPNFAAAAARADTAGTRIKLLFRLTLELLWAGRNTEALGALEEIRRTVGAVGDRVPAATRTRTLADARELAVLAHLRNAEQSNCLCSANADSCIFPITEGGIHLQKDGARKAADLLLECLEETPNDLSLRWLLNMVFMTLGEHPDKVPPQWLIPRRVFDSERDIGWFSDVAMERGADVVGLAGGCSMEDFDGDGDLDIVASAWGLHEQLRFLRNDGHGSFVDATEEAGLLGQVGGLNISHADYDNDGDLDLLVLRGGWFGPSGAAQPHSLLRNRGEGFFDDVTESAGLLSSHPGQVGVWADLDSDGWLDLFLGHEDDGSETHPSLLFRNRGDGTFEECARASGVSGLGFVKGAAWGDYDNDNRPDLYVSTLLGPSRLLRNEGPPSPEAAAGAGFAWRFRDVTDAAGVAGRPFGFAAWFFDYDNDGWLDLFSAGYQLAPVGEVAAEYLGVPVSSATSVLYRNQGDGTFADVTREVKLDRGLMVMGCGFGDLDNDGWLDLYLGTGAPDLRVLMPNRMFRNAAGRAFEDVTTSGGFGHLQKGHGVAFGDIDSDGDQDIYCVLGGWVTADLFQNALFENPGHGNNWIKLRLRGTRTNRSAVGARIKVVHGEGAARREVHRAVGFGSSFGSANLEQAIGLGASKRAAAIEVIWPVTGRAQTLRDIPAGRTLEIIEYDG